MGLHTFQGGELRSVPANEPVTDEHYEFNLVNRAGSRASSWAAAHSTAMLDGQCHFAALSGTRHLRFTFSRACRGTLRGCPEFRRSGDRAGLPVNRNGETYLGADVR